MPGIDRQRLARVEVWAGAAPIPPPGSEPAFPVDVRWSALARYRTKDAQLTTLPATSVGRTSVQAGIAWQLIHVEP